MAGFDFNGLLNFADTMRELEKATKKIRTNNNKPSVVNYGKPQRKTNKSPGSMTKTQTNKKKKRTRVVSTVQKTQFKGHVKPGPKRKKKDIYLEQGDVIKTERGGSVSASDLQNSVYAGYGTPMKTLTGSIWRAIVKKLATKSGFTIRDFLRPIGYDLAGLANLPAKQTILRFRIQWRYASTTTTPSQVLWTSTSFDIYNNTGTLNTTNTWSKISQDIETAFNAAVSSGVINTSGGGSLHVDNIAMGIYTTDDIEIPLANINGEDIKIYIKVNTGMKVSNVTRAAGSEDGAELDADNITANPLTGKLYTIMSWSNGFVQKNQSFNDVSGVFLAPTVSNPVFTTTSNQTNSNLLKKPPKFYFFDKCKREQPVNLEPGEIKQFGTGFEATFTLNTFINKYSDYFSQDATQFTSRMLAPFGYSQMIGLECMLNNRNESQAVTSIDYEINQTIGCYVSVKKAKTQPILDVS